MARYFAVRSDQAASAAAGAPPAACAAQHVVHRPARPHDPSDGRRPQQVAGDYILLPASYILLPTSDFLFSCLSLVTSYFLHLIQAIIVLLLFGFVYAFFLFSDPNPTGACEEDRWEV